jgi:hypothetical protein
LREILTYHVVPAKVAASEVTAGDVETVNGADLTISVVDGIVVLEDGQGNEAKVTRRPISKPRTRSSSDRCRPVNALRPTGEPGRRGRPTRRPGPIHEEGSKTWKSGSPVRTG